MSLGEETVDVSVKDEVWKVAEEDKVPLAVEVDWLTDDWEVLETEEVLIANSEEGGLLPTFNVVVNCWVNPLGASRLVESGSVEPASKLVYATVAVPEEMGWASARMAACVMGEMGWVLAAWSVEAATVEDPLVVLEFAGDDVWEPVVVVGWLVTEVGSVWADPVLWVELVVSVKAVPEMPANMLPAALAGS